MPRNNFICFLILFVWAASACQATPITPTKLPFSQPSPPTSSAEETRIPTIQATTTPTKVAPPSSAPPPTILPTLTQTASPTPALRIDLSRYDPDVHPEIDVHHNPPLIARSDEKVKLAFSFVCTYMMRVAGARCDYKPTLFYSYGEKNDFASIPLQRDLQDEEGNWPATLPATNADGAPLRYYVQVIDPQVGLDLRFPAGTTIDLFAAPDLIPIDLPAQKPEEPGNVVLAMPWGSGPEAVGLRKKQVGYPFNVGPIAMDVGEDGRIALLDQINGRVMIYDPTNKSYTIIPLSFTLWDQGDVQFDRTGQIAVFDPVGKPMGQSSADIPQLYRLLPDGRIDAVAPVYAGIPAWLTKDLKVVDLRYSKLVVPFSPSGEANTREAQRQMQPAELLAKYMTYSVHVVRLADTQKGLAFEVRSVSPLGAITYLEKTPQGYVAVFEGDQLRAIWFNAAGSVLQDITLPGDRYSEFNSLGRAAIDPDGSLYVLGSEEKGVVVRYVKAP